MTFDACYTTSPLCAPARLSFTACQYISRSGGWNNDCRLSSDDYTSTAGVLRDAEYGSYLCGKQHYPSDHRYGFTDIPPEVYSNRGLREGRGKRRDPGDTSEGRHAWRSRRADFRTGDDSRIIQHDRMVTDRACHFLSHWERDQRPFFLFVGHLAPHFPLIVPEPFYRKYQRRVPIPDIPDGLIENLPINYQQLRYAFGVTQADDETTQLGRDLSWAFVDWYDGQVGKIIDALRQSAVAENTVVIYTSDHGENKGDHGLWWKNNLYEHGARVPLVMTWPCRWQGGQRRQGACSFVDLVQTIADLAGAPTPETWDGDSMLPWLDDAESPWKDQAR